LPRLLYAANTRAGTIDVFNSSFDPVPLADLGHHAFETPGQIAARGLVPFNVTQIGGHVYVTYAPAGRAAQLTAGEGDGAVAIFSESGNLEPHGVIISGHVLALLACRPEYLDTDHCSFFLQYSAFVNDHGWLGL
jgi:hypothetical protein